MGQVVGRVILIVGRVILIVGQVILIVGQVILSMGRAIRLALATFMSCQMLYHEG